MEPERVVDGGERGAVSSPRTGPSRSTETAPTCSALTFDGSRKPASCAGSRTWNGKTRATLLLIGTTVTTPRPSRAATAWARSLLAGAALDPGACNGPRRPRWTWRAAAPGVHFALTPLIAGRSAQAIPSDGAERPGPGRGSGRSGGCGAAASGSGASGAPSPSASFEPWAPRSGTGLGMGRLPARPPRRCRAWHHARGGFGAHSRRRRRLRRGDGRPGSIPSQPVAATGMIEAV